MIVYFIYATIIGWLVMILINYHSHKRYIVKHKDKFFSIMDHFYEEPDSLTSKDKFAFSFTPELIEKREFVKYLKYGKFKYIILDTTMILLSFLIIFIISFILEFLPFTSLENYTIDFKSVFIFVLIGYIVCIIDAYSKTLKYDKIISQWYNDGKEKDQPEK